MLYMKALWVKLYPNNNNITQRDKKPTENLSIEDGEWLKVRKITPTILSTYQT